jgi:hypothetical protein
VKIGDVVKICEEGVRRGDWPIGRVVDLFPGQDGVVRVAKVPTFHGYLVRPVAKLVVSANTGWRMCGKRLTTVINY